jgi:hypothetical protein
MAKILYIQEKSQKYYNSKILFVMKSKIVVLVAFVFGVFVTANLISCQKEKTTTPDISFDYEQIGIEHNKGLDYIFEYLKEKKINKKSALRSTTNIFDLIEQATLSFAKTSKILRNVNHKELPLTFQNFNREVLKSAGNNNLTYLINSKINLNPSQITFLNELDNVISNLEIGLELTIEKIKKIELDIISQCSVDEAKILLSATSVARYSLEYWTENYEKWIIELGGMEIGAMNELKSISSRGGWDWFCDTLKSMGKSDVVGGAIGAGVGALAGGVGAAPGAVAGACYSSAGRGIVALLDHWEVW